MLEGVWAGGGGRRGVIAVDDIVVLEGTCEPAPPQSRPSPGACQFTNNACDWRNTTSDDRGRQRWQISVPKYGSAPHVLLPDHTFRASTGFAYFDIFSFSSQDEPETLRLVSPLLEAPAGGDGRVCVTFWFRPLVRESSAQLRVLHETRTSGDGEDAQFAEPSVLWSLRASETGKRHLTWIYGQASVQAAQSYRVTFEGIATKYGFALDDVSFDAGECGGKRRRRESTSDAST